MTATATYSDGSSRVVSAEAVWSSSNVAVAIVAANGIVTFVGGGTSRISAVFQGQSGSWDVNVISIDPSDALSVVTITPTAGSTIARGSTVDFNARLQYTLVESTGRIGAVAEVNNNPNAFAEITPVVNATLVSGSGTVDLAGRFTVPSTAGTNARILFQLFPAGASRTNVLAIVSFPLQ